MFKPEWDSKRSDQSTVITSSSRATVGAVSEKKKLMLNFNQKTYFVFVTPETNSAK